MTEIVFEDILTHYYLRLKQALDEAENIRLITKSAASLADKTWQGDGSDSFQDKMAELDLELSKANTDLSEAMKSIAVINNLIC